MKRNLTGEISERVDQEVFLQGWVQTIRLHSKVMFIDLRDREGVAQVVVTEDQLASLKDLTTESVISVKGKVVKRPTSLVNPNLKTGAVELQASQVTIISLAEPLPMPLNDESVGEDVRLKYRYLDLRSNRLRENFQLRHQAENYIRQFLTDRDFLEIETPIISKSTPEGARDFLLPSRVEPGKFFALPQSPQQYKQLLMVAGVERYFQIARCFRDEDSRLDRQPEFTQLDLEMSFTDQEEVLGLTEELVLGLVKKVFPGKLLTSPSIPHLTYQEAMAKYQTDRPDLRRDKTNPDELSFCFVVDFPMFEWKEKEKRFDATHHPFTAPQPQWQENFEKKPKEALSLQYDLVLNGTEIFGGSMRIHDPQVLERVFAFLGHPKEKIQADFGHLLEAFKYGVPPHGGIAAGLDRLLAILLKQESIREVIAFPKTGDGRDLMMNAPSAVDGEQLKELGLKLTKS